MKYVILVFLSIYFLSFLLFSILQERLRGDQRRSTYHLEFPKIPNRPRLSAQIIRTKSFQYIVRYFVLLQVAYRNVLFGTITQRIPKSSHWYLSFSYLFVYFLIFFQHDNDDANNHYGDGDGNGLPLVCLTISLWKYLIKAKRFYLLREYCNLDGIIQTRSSISYRRINIKNRFSWHCYFREKSLSKSSSKQPSRIPNQQWNISHPKVDLNFSWPAVEL